MTWSQDDVEPGRLNQDEARQAIACLAGMDCAYLHVASFSTHPSAPSLCSVPLPLLVKTSASTKMWRWVLRQESPIFQVAGRENKPLSFTSAPASQVLALQQQGTQTCFQLVFGNSRWDNADSNKVQRAQHGVLAASGRLTQWQGLQKFPSSC